MTTWRARLDEFARREPEALALGALAAMLLVAAVLLAFVLLVG